MNSWRLRPCNSMFRTLRLSSSSYEATRETKEQPTLARLAEAKKLIAGNADSKQWTKMGAQRFIGPYSAQATQPSQPFWLPTRRLRAI